MNVFQRFWYALHGYRVRTEGEPEPSPYGKPGVYEDDVAFILKEHSLRKYSEREYVGDGAAQAEERRRRSLGIEPAEPPAIESKKKKRRRLSKEERLRQKLERLKTDVEELEKAAK